MALRFLLSKEFQEADIEGQRRFMALALTDMEMMLPLSWSDISVHLLLHVHSILLAFPTLHMLYVERFHTFFKKLFSRRSPNPLLTVARRYNRHQEGMRRTVPASQTSSSSATTSLEDLKVPDYMRREFIYRFTGKAKHVEVGTATFIKLLAYYSTETKNKLLKNLVMKFETAWKHSTKKKKGR